MIEKEVQLRQQDQTNLQLIYYKETYMNYAMIFLFIVAVIMGIEMVWSKDFDIIRILISVLGILYPIFVHVQAIMISKKQIQSPSMQEPIAYNVTDKSLQISGYQFSRELAWKDAFDHLEDKHSFYVYTSAVQAYIIPKRYFDESEITEVRNIIAKNVVQQKRTGKRIFSIIVITFLLLILAEFLFKPFA